jgi:hypothetical protein
MNSFSARIYKIGVNPYVLIPVVVLKEVFKQANKTRGPIPVRGYLNGFLFMQTLVKYSGKWRLYLNTPMRKGAGIDVGDIAEVKIEFDPRVRKVAMHPKLKLALEKNEKAKQKFEQLSPYRQKEILRYIGNLKSEETVDKNVKRAISFLIGKERFVGRDKP